MWLDYFISTRDGDNMTDDEETVCLNEGQLKNIAKAARGDKGACPKAVQFVKALLKGDRKKEKSKKRKQKKDNDVYPSLEIAEKYGKKLVNRLLNRW